MTQASLLGSDLLSPALARQLDLVCDRFETAWKAGQRPEIEPYLGATPEPERSTLLRELLSVELSYRNLSGERALPEEYQARFPEQEELIRSVFRELTTEQPSTGSGVDDPESLRATMPYQRELEKLAAGTTVPLPTPSIGKYRVVERLGGGGQGDVFRAVNPSLPGRDVVIKWARKTLSTSAQQQLLAEGRVLARLEDPGLVRVYDADIHEGRPFLVFEHVKGRSLHDQLREGLPSFRQAALLVAQLAQTLGRVHRHNILHRDLKPHNVLMDDTGRPRLLDFGLAWMRSPFGEEEEMPDSSVRGTLHYMPPEQARGQNWRQGPASDVFGLGAVLYELLTGRPPYQADTARALWEQARQGQVIPPRQLNRRIPRRLEAICLKALAANPEQRYPTAGHLERALRRFLLLHRRLWPALAAGLFLCVASALLAHGMSSREHNPVNPGSTAATEADPQVALNGTLTLRVWSHTGRKLGIKVQDPGALPVLNGEAVQAEVQLNQPAYVYLIWLDSEGQVLPLYPWDPKNKTLGPAPKAKPVQKLRSPPQDKDGWETDGPSGLDTMLLLARRTPLPATYDFPASIGKVPRAPFRDAREYALRGCDFGRETAALDEGLHRGIKTEARRIDEPLLDLLQRLHAEFELIRAVRFAHLGN